MGGRDQQNRDKMRETGEERHLEQGERGELAGDKKAGKQGIKGGKTGDKQRGKQGIKVA